MSQPLDNSESPLEAVPMARLEYQNSNRIAGEGMYWREGKSLRVLDGAELPCRCVKCNSAEDVTMTKRTLNWCPQWTFLLIFVNILIFIVVALCLRRKVTLTYGLCGRHRRLRVWGMVSGYGGVAFGILLLIVAAISSGPNKAQPWVYFAAVIVIVAALASGLAMVHIFRVQTIRNGSAWLRGVSREFLETV